MNNPSAVRELRGRWDRCFFALSLQPPSDPFESIIERYNEPHRAYHTLQHISECFKQLDRVHDTHAPGEVGLALWFHDAIQRAGIEKAKAAGVYKGRPVTLDHDRLVQMRKEGAGATEIAKVLKCSRSAVYKVLNAA